MLKATATLSCDSSHSIVGWPDLAKFLQFGEILKVIGKFARAHLCFGKILLHFLQVFCNLANCKWSKIEYLFQPSENTVY